VIDIKQKLYTSWSLTLQQGKPIWTKEVVDCPAAISAGHFVQIVTIISSCYTLLCALVYCNERFLYINKFERFSLTRFHISSLLCVGYTVLENKCSILYPNKDTWTRVNFRRKKLELFKFPFLNRKPSTNKQTKRKQRWIHFYPPSFFWTVTMAWSKKVMWAPNTFWMRHWKTIQAFFRRRRD
jgi:hypothetical protein